MRLPPIYEHCRLDNYDASDNPSALKAAESFAAGNLRSLLLLGSAGTGKTHLAVGAARAAERDEVIEMTGSNSCRIQQRARRALFCPVLILAGDLRRAVRGGDDPEDGCRDADILVLDDWGAERSTDYVLEALERIVDVRYLYRRPTIVTSNLPDVAAVLARYGDRMLSRFSECGAVVTLRGRDRRPERRA